MNKVGKKCFRWSRKIKQLHHHLRTTANLILKEEKENKSVGRKEEKRKKGRRWRMEEKYKQNMQEVNTELTENEAGEIYWN